MVAACDSRGIQVEVDAGNVEQVGAARRRRDTTIAVLGHVTASSSDDEARRRGDIEQVGTIASGTDDIDHVVTVECHRLHQLTHDLGRRGDLVGGLALVDAAQYLVRAGFQSQIDHFEAELVQQVEILLLFAQDGRRGAVARDALALGEQLFDIAQDLRHMLGAVWPFCCVAKLQAPPK